MFLEVSMFFYHILSEESAYKSIIEIFRVMAKQKGMTVLLALPVQWISPIYSLRSLSLSESVHICNYPEIVTIPRLSKLEGFVGIQQMTHANIHVPT